MSKTAIFLLGAAVGSLATYLVNKFIQYKKAHEVYEEITFDEFMAEREARKAAEKEQEEKKEDPPKDIQPPVEPPKEVMAQYEKLISTYSPKGDPIEVKIANGKDPEIIDADVFGLDENATCETLQLYSNKVLCTTFGDVISDIDDHIGLANMYRLLDNPDSFESVMYVKNYDLEKEYEVIYNDYDYDPSLYIEDIEE